MHAGVIKYHTKKKNNNNKLSKKNKKKMGRESNV